ncbi:MAG: tRNA pseudouridine(38-40) synthase TruA, partial [Jatrophihabitans sp.]
VGGVDALRPRFVLGGPPPLEPAPKHPAAHRRVGLRDVAAFGKFRPEGTTIRTLERFEVVRTGAELVATVQADAFCHSMVRSLIGALLAVGEGRRPVDWPASLLAGSVRAQEVSVAPAHGLTLVEVAYPPDDELPARVERTRAKRPTGD